MRPVVFIGPTRCPRHPRYKAKNPPLKCPVCLQVYKNKQRWEKER